MLLPRLRGQRQVWPRLRGVQEGCGLCPGSPLTMLPVGFIMLATGLGNQAQVLTCNLHKLFKGALESIRQKCCKNNNTTEIGDRQGYNILFYKPSCSLLYIFRGKKKHRMQLFYSLQRTDFDKLWKAHKGLALGDRKS